MNAPFTMFGPILSPRSSGSADWWSDGALAVDERGTITYVGEASTLPEHLRPLPFQHTTDLILPGFIDAHVHLPQLDCRGKFGEDLLHWLHHYIYPAEERFADEAVARSTASRFFAALTNEGTTTAMIFGTTNEKATHIAFEEAEQSGLRILMGSMLMDRNAPDQLCLDVAPAVASMERLIEHWHRVTPLLRYAVSPRFAPACSPALLRAAADTAARHDLHIQTHVNESRQEILLVRELFPEAASYTDVYLKAGLLGPKTILGHSVHTDQNELTIIAERDAAIAHCPDSNLFLGSGRFPLDLHRRHGVRIALGSDVGAGTTLSMLTVMRSMAHAQGSSLHPFVPLYHATLGGAVALGLEDETGSLQTGKSADFITVAVDRQSGEADIPPQDQCIETASSLVYRTPEERVRRVWVQGTERTPQKKQN